VRLTRIPILVAFASCLPAQRISVAVKGGLPLTAVADTAQEAGRFGGQSSFQLKRYTFGPSVEVGLPLGFRAEVDALYKHARQDRFAGPAPGAVLTQEGRRMDIWEFPLLLKRPFGIRRVQPYAVAGAALRRIAEFEVDRISIPTFPGFPSTREQFTTPSHEGVRAGIVAGGGLTWKLGPMRLEPELRYTHWTAKRWMATTEQVEFLLGVRFPLGKDW
jgi:hypothetical protein